MKRNGTEEEMEKKVGENSKATQRGTQTGAKNNQGNRNNRNNKRSVKDQHEMNDKAALRYSTLPPPFEVLYITAAC